MLTEKRKKYLKIWREKNRQKLRDQHNLWYSNHKNDAELKKTKSIQFRNWYENNREKSLLKGREWRLNNIERARENKKRWNKNNPEKYKIMRRKELNNVSSKIASYMRTRMRLAILSQQTWEKGKTLELLGCSISELKGHLQKQFTDDMSWDNYGRWHIDHIKPYSSFDLSNPEEQKKCFHYTNLQPLWAIDNLEKGRKYEK